MPKHNVSKLKAVQQNIRVCDTLYLYIYIYIFYFFWGGGGGGAVSVKSGLRSELCGDQSLAESRMDLGIVILEYGHGCIF